MATAAELKKTLETATEEEARAILQEEQAQEEPRSTVVSAAEARLETLAVPGEPQDSTPSGVWAQLLDADGKPVLVDGQPVKAELTPATRREKASA